MRTPKGKKGSMSVRRRDGEASVVSRVAGYAAMMPSGTRTPLDKAFMDTVMQRFPPALSPARQTRSAVEPATQTRSCTRFNMAPTTAVKDQP